MSPEVADYNVDNMEFNITMPESLLEFARIIENPQQSMIKSFVLSVDRGSILPENLGLYTIVLNVTDDHEEEPSSSIFSFSLEVVELIPEEKVEEEVIEEVEEEKEHEEDTDLKPSFVPS